MYARHLCAYKPNNTHRPYMLVGAFFNCNCLIYFATDATRLGRDTITCQNRTAEHPSLLNLASFPCFSAATMENNAPATSHPFIDLRNPPKSNRSKQRNNSTLMNSNRLNTQLFSPPPSQEMDKEKEMDAARMLISPPPEEILQSERKAVSLSIMASLVLFAKQHGCSSRTTGRVQSPNHHSHPLCLPSLHNTNPLPTVHRNANDPQSQLLPFPLPQTQTSRISLNSQ